MATLLSDSDHLDEHGDRVLLGSRARGPRVVIPGFEILSRIGKGGMSQVYRARHEATGRQVALKTVRPDIAEEIGRMDVVERLLAEGGLLTGLSHPYLMPIYGLGDAGERLYISMQYAPAGDLDARIQDGMSVMQTLKITHCMADALDFAHKHGLVHRDVKPGNILFLENGTPLLSDFGLAKPFELDLQLTATGMVLGSPHYMSPEQAMGTSVDGRTDIYSLGALLFTMLTGNPPYHACKTYWEALRMHVEGPVPELPHPHGWLQSLITRSMAKNPDRRFATAGAMASGLAKAALALHRAQKRQAKKRLERGS